ncbi:hypothetical protein N7462_003419 [Penicillium macrosclerotiorum]|uniref:uncharacterized protein n=1 Tax=Penicillium macrosclerotiorum TaxID=303699 RepID=UPI0025487C4C|nr:uncharacterized protein N7462_003419 [Penicillium macrosclerotiorum]KAJ5689027.1 hypothetical protein N7462_003419 [Penicillium macrosclerotiorum]
MQVTIIPASTNTGAATIRSLLSKPVQIRGVYRDLSKVPATFLAQPNFSAIEGDISKKGSFSLKESDAILAIMPPVFDGQDPVQQAERASLNIKTAIEMAGDIKKVVLLSSVGAEFSEGVGEIKTNNRSEEVFRGTEVEHLVFVRCSYFMENWTINLDPLRGPDPYFFSTITPTDYEIPMVSISDVGATLAEQLLDSKPPPEKPYIVELHGPRRYSPLDARAAFTRALGKKVELQAIERDHLHQFYAQCFPPSIVDYWVEMAESILPEGKLGTKYLQQARAPVIYGHTDLATVIEENCREFSESAK